MSQEDISSHMNTIPVTGRNLPSQEETCCQREKFPVSVRKFLSKEKIHVLGIEYKKRLINERNFTGKKLCLR